MTNNTLLQLELPGIKKLKSGKVREIFDLGDAFLFVASDRISAFDCVMPNGIPRKGEVLTQVSHFWFDQTETLVPNHRLVKAGESFNVPALAHIPAETKAALAKRAMIVKKSKPLAIECVVRGYLAGSGWKDYRATGEVCGHKLPPGLELASELPSPIFTPSTKNEAGHALNIDWAQCCAMIGQESAGRVRERSLEIYRAGKQHAASRGIIVADTKFEFGLTNEGDLLLIDECLTPDSSRFWPADSYAPGSSPSSFDKQFVRDYLETLDWDKTCPGPKLPNEVIEKTSAKYREAFRRLTGHGII